jgi:tetratricopeptide (TPR) repeat protein
MLCSGCSQKIEPETILCPNCGVEGSLSAPSGRVCDIFLMGFSDPSSSDQMVDFLLERSFWRSRDKVLVFLSNPPVLLTKGMEAGRARLLREEVEKRGGIVELRERQMTDRGAAKKIIREGVQESETPVQTGSSVWGGKGYLVLFLLSMVAVVYLALQHDFSKERKTVQMAVRKITSHLPASAKNEDSAFSRSKAEEVASSDELDPEGVRLNNEGVAFMDEGRYEEAVQSFKEALLIIPQDATIRQNLHRAWMQQGYRALDSKEYEKAILLFEEAVKVSSQSSEAYKLMGMAAMSLTDEQRAEEYLRTYLNKVPDDEEVSRILGEILYKQNRLDEGLHLLKIYLAANPGDRRVRNLVDKAGREADIEEGFDTHEGEHFDVRFDGTENMDAGYLVVGILRDVYIRIGAEMNFYPPDRMVTILYSDEDFRNVTQTPDWTRALYDGKIRIPIGGLKGKSLALERIVSHEYTHALIHQMTDGRCPSWLNEGLAQYFEGEPGEMHARNGAYILRTRDFIPLPKLEGSFLNMDAETASIAYTQSYTLVDLIIEEYGIYVAQKLLSILAEGVDVEPAIQEALGVDYPALQEEWLQYLTRKYS